MEQLPIYKIKGKFYFLDRRLGEYRNIKNNPSDRIEFNSFPKLQKPTAIKGYCPNCFSEMRDFKKCLVCGFEPQDNNKIKKIKQ